MNSSTQTESSRIRVYFLGSGELAVPVLRALHADARIELVGVGTQPDRPVGRKKVLAPTPLGQAAAELAGLPAIDKFASYNTPEFTAHLVEHGVDFVVVVSFGQLLKQALLDAPRYACVNVHASLLPLYRGASPVTAAILHGDAAAGVSIMQMDAGLDTGPVYRQFPVPVTDDDTTATLGSKLGAMAAARLGDVLEDVKAGRLSPRPQPSDAPRSYAGKLKKADGAVQWGLPAVELWRRIRAYRPWPTVYGEFPTTKGIKRVQLMEAQVVDSPRTDAMPGELLSIHSDGIVVACGTGALRITRIVPEGRNEMSVAEFLRGTQLLADTKLQDYSIPTDK